jgi:hypothetical protein
MSQAEQNHNTLMELKKNLAKEPAPAPVYKYVIERATYETTRNRISTRAYVEKVKKDQVVLKRDKDSIDSYTVSRAKFEQYYRLVTVPDDVVATPEVLGALTGLIQFAKLLKHLKTKLGIEEPVTQ